MPVSTTYLISFAMVQGAMQDMEAREDELNSSSALQFTGNCMGGGC